MKHRGTPNPDCKIALGETSSHSALHKTAFQHPTVFVLYDKYAVMIIIEDVKYEKKCLLLD